MILTHLKLPFLKTFSFTVLTPIILFWLSLYALGYPLPGDDDLFFIGAGINLAETGNFVNPFLAQWAEQTIDRFYVQPPFYSYALAPWLNIFGITTRSFLLFQFFCYSSFSTFLALTLRKLKFSPLASWAIIVCAGLWLLIGGLRQDAFATALLMAGLYYLLTDHLVYYLIGFTILGLSVLSSPVNIAYATPLAWGILIRNFVRHKKDSSSMGQYITPRLLMLLSAIVIVFLLFLLSINFELTRFFADLSWHSQLRRSPVSRMIPNLIFIVTVGYGEITYGLLYLFSLFLGALLWVKHKTTPKSLFFIILSLILSIILGLITYANTLGSNVNFVIWVIVILTLDKLSIKAIHQRTLAVIASVLVLINYSPAILNLVFVDHSPDPPEKIAEILDYVTNNPEKTYFIDGIAARYIFDYNLPAESVSWEFSGEPAMGPPTSLTEKAENAVWILSRRQAWHVAELPDYPRLKLLGHRFKSIASQPHKILLIP
ncbi:hypothetical protein K4A83_11765 [Spirulina subsalsa FACHB-351]|uniref:Glycosyltransferase RgtA/B/C/D-like domain-containing protein n=1 Tax=Spirulina subsalsa FACHB-351 TaxID=234711 RepID=A0ABT3L5Z6_9CYAN|nr:hypothetical protein [Spirulina subsalsa]MCW6036935.1 hypothetical protein [Spirulina subsalsa FACHB-351]